MRISFLIFLFICIAIAGCNVNEPAERVFTNGNIWTGNPEQPWADAMAVTGETIVAIGTDADLNALRGVNTEVVDLEGAFVMPGFIDNHAHFLSGGFQLASVDLRTATSAEEFSARLATFSQIISQGRWIIGGDWDHEAWGGALPHRSWIDDVTSDNPVFVSRYDGHMALANSKTLELAGIDRTTPDPEGGTIVRDPSTGEPTGVLKDEAMGLVYAVMPDPTIEEFDEAFDRAVDHALSYGVTQIHDVGSFGGWTDLEVFRRAQSQARLPLRIYSIVPLRTWEQLQEYVQREGNGDDWVRWGGLKGFVDGSLGSTTAWFYEPYEDEPGTSGLIVVDTTAMRQDIQLADAAGFQLAIHAIGDQANDWLLNVYNESIQQNGERDRRPRIEHAQHLTSGGINRIAELGVIPSMQPYHAIDDGRWAEKRIGLERIKTTYAFNSLLQAGAHLTFGSDWTVAPLNPLEGIYAAVTRQTIDGNNPDGWVPEQKILVEQAMRAYTLNNAYAGFQEDKLGTLEVGKYADFVVLSDNILEIAPDDIKSVEVLKTIIGGLIRYEN